MSEPKLTLQQFAWANAALDAGRSKSEVLPQLGLDEQAWRGEQQHWLGLIAQRLEFNRLDLAQRYASDYATYRFQNGTVSTAIVEQRRPALGSAKPPPLPPPPGQEAPAPAPSAPPPRALDPVLSLYEFAMLQAELELSPQAAERTWGKYGLGESSSRQNEQDAWQQRLRDDAALRSEYKRLHADALRHWRSLMRR
jgi:hypothetical protein